MWIALLLLSWCVEGVVGIWFCLNRHPFVLTQSRLALLLVAV